MKNWTTESIYIDSKVLDQAQLKKLREDEKWILNHLGNMFDADRKKAKRELANLRKQIKFLTHKSYEHHCNACGEHWFSYSDSVSVCKFCKSTNLTTN